MKSFRSSLLLKSGSSICLLFCLFACFPFHQCSFFSTFLLVLIKSSMFSVPELVWVKIYSSADKSLTGIKRGKVSVLTYWTALSAPQRHFYSVLMATIVHFSYPKAQPVNIQVEITLVLHKIQTANLLVVVVLQFCPCVCCVCVCVCCVCTFIHMQVCVCWWCQGPIQAKPSQRLWL